MLEKEIATLWRVLVRGPTKFCYWNERVYSPSSLSTPSFSPTDSMNVSPSSSLSMAFSSSSGSHLPSFSMVDWTSHVLYRSIFPPIILNTLPVICLPSSLARRPRVGTRCSDPGSRSRVSRKPSSWLRLRVDWIVRARFSPGSLCSCSSRCTFSSLSPLIW